jgi:hypothetical protein
MADAAAQPKDKRAQRLAEALRDNLRRRKEQARRRAKADTAANAQPTDPTAAADTITGNGRSPAA